MKELLFFPRFLQFCLRWEGVSFANSPQTDASSVFRTREKRNFPPYTEYNGRRLRNSVRNGIVWTIQTICTSLRTSSWTKDVEWAKTELSERSEFSFFANAFPHLEWMLEVLGAEAVWMFIQFPWSIDFRNCLLIFLSFYAGPQPRKEETASHPAQCGRNAETYLTVWRDFPYVIMNLIGCLKGSR